MRRREVLLGSLALLFTSPSVYSEEKVVQRRNLEGHVEEWFVRGDEKHKIPDKKYWFIGRDAKFSPVNPGSFTCLQDSYLLDSKGLPMPFILNENLVRIRNNHELRPTSKEFADIEFRYEIKKDEPKLGVSAGATFVDLAAFGKLSLVLDGKKIAGQPGKELKIDLQELNKTKNLQTKAYLLDDLPIFGPYLKIETGQDMESADAKIPKIPRGRILYEVLPFDGLAPFFSERKTTPTLLRNALWKAYAEDGTDRLEGNNFKVQYRELKHD